MSVFPSCSDLRKDGIRSSVGYAVELPGVGIGTIQSTGHGFINVKIGDTVYRKRHYDLRYVDENLIQAAYLLIFLRNN